MRFDDAIDTALAVIRKQLGQRPSRITLVRDVAGQLTAVLEDATLKAAEWENLARALHERLGPVSPGLRRVLLKRSDLIDEHDVLASPDRVRLREEKDVWLLDRLLTNQDWLRQPPQGPPPLPLATTFSLKGGVGRSTAVAVWAWHLAREGRKVVAVDLDLEAPGLGSLLVDELPAYGMVDWLTEALLLCEPSLELLDDCLAFSPVAEDAEGVIQVLPAFGRDTRDYIAKLGRIYVPGLAPDGHEIGLAERIGELLKSLARRDEPPDVVLLDSRAGLHDIGAAAVTRLGAEAFLFGRDEPQSWRAYRLLFEHLSRSKGVQFGMPDHDLRWRLKMAAAQVDKTEGAIASWIDASYDAWSALYDDESHTPEGHAAQTFERNEPNAPHYPLTVYFDGQLRGMELTDSSRRPPWRAIEAAFGEFFAGATARLIASGEMADVDRGES